MDIEKPFSNPNKEHLPKYSFKEGYSFQSLLKRLLSPSGQTGKQESPWRLLLNSKKEKKPLPEAQKESLPKAQKGPLPRVFKRNDYREWLQENSKDLSAIFKHRLSKRQIVERGMSFLPSKVGTGFVEGRHIKSTIKELEKKYRDKAYFKERPEIERDLKVIEKYEEKLRGL